MSQLSKVTQWVDGMSGSGKRSEYFADHYGFCFTSTVGEIPLLLMLFHVIHGERLESIDSGIRLLWFACRFSFKTLVELLNL